MKSIFFHLLQFKVNVIILKKQQEGVSDEKMGNYADDAVFNSLR